MMAKEIVKKTLKRINIITGAAACNAGIMAGSPIPINKGDIMRILLLLITMLFSSLSFAGLEVGTGLLSNRITSSDCSGSCSLLRINEASSSEKAAVILSYFHKTGPVDLGGELILSDQQIHLFTVRKPLGKWSISGSVGVTNRINSDALDVASVKSKKTLAINHDRGTVVGVGASHKAGKGKILAKLLRVSAESDVSISYKGKYHVGNANIETDSTIVMVGYSLPF